MERGESFSTLWLEQIDAMQALSELWQALATPPAADDGTQAAAAERSAAIAEACTRLQERLDTLFAQAQRAATALAREPGDHPSWPWTLPLEWEPLRTLARFGPLQTEQQRGVECAAAAQRCLQAQLHCLELLHESACKGVERLQQRLHPTPPAAADTATTGATTGSATSGPATSGPESAGAQREASEASGTVDTGRSEPPPGEAAADQRARPESLRALYQLWLEESEQAYEELLADPRWSRAFSELMAATTELIAGYQEGLDRHLQALDLPNRSDFLDTQRRLDRLEREQPLQERDRTAALSAEVARLQREVAELRADLTELRRLYAHHPGAKGRNKP
ncbi:hypothetical protein CKO15_02260 [Halorhodospira abdelmalekii]|uniref:poly(R)-hydroxyalkanoic acid synthase subunit PhaE n=1 Tax=Halorhodospira abdelmalekii TaxID=421629 RepID=UPI001903F205|nr:poly(R)-hydroxyalkanoic acid synthase subunit PhaE [Halorhodospira abdelmalekii]MBK1734123.1 hypothetical protein [Halorhodospira abdelmalekii]